MTSASQDIRTLLISRRYTQTKRKYHSNLVHKRTVRRKNATRRSYLCGNERLCCKLCSSESTTWSFRVEAIMSENIRDSFSLQYLLPGAPRHSARGRAAHVLREKLPHKPGALGRVPRQQSEKFGLNQCCEANTKEKKQQRNDHTVPKSCEGGI